MKQRSFFDRYRGVVLGAFALVGLGVIAFVFIQSANAQPYTCEALVSPPPSESAPSPGQGLGFVPPDQGVRHVASGTPITYSYCPPTSGTHFSAGPRAPLPRAFYDSSASVGPGNWVHNLEHGWVVMAYRHPEGEEGPTADEIADMRTVFDTAPASTVGAAATGAACQPNKLIFVRFDQMTSRFGLMAWNRLLLTDTFDPEEALTFYEQWVDSPQAPEQGFCP